MNIRTLIRLPGILAALAFCSAFAQPPHESATARYFDSIKTQPQKIHQFLWAMPKGGDLHNHESGASYAENLIHYGLNDHLCVNPDTYAVSVNAGCKTENLLTNAVKDPVYYDAILDAWSMRHANVLKESGHDHFFATFSKFGAISGNHHGEMLAEIAQRAGLQNESYLETMITLDNGASSKLGEKLGWNPDFDTMRQNLLAAGFDKIIASVSENLDRDEAVMRSTLACDSNAPQAGCAVKVRYQYQASRAAAPEKVFAQLLAGFESVRHDKRVVGLNLVSPEDGPISMQDYTLQMQMIAYLHGIYPDVPFSLHAGELNSAIAPEEGLKFHINQAVTIAKANRIGHGVDIAQEDNYENLLKTMADQKILVEINLTSNAYILNMEGKNHPLPLYMRYGVPVTISTDDEGVSRSNMTKEYERAVKDFQFDYATLKYFARNSLSYSFLPGQALWADTAYSRVVADCQSDMLGSGQPSASCQAFLQQNEKANAQWDLEKRFTEFESHY